jgi:hypothetical protein
MFVKNKHMSRIQLAKDKYNKRRDTNPPYHLSLQEFIIECFLDYAPASYGKYLQEKIVRSCFREGVNIKRISDKENKGDCELVYPFSSLKTEHDGYNGKHMFTWTPSEKFKVKKNFEIKVSYLGKNGKYTLRNLRPYQNMVGGYIICLIDCDLDFQPKFYLVDELVIFQNFTLSHMNGVGSEHNTNQGFENYGISIGDGSYGHIVLRDNNKLLGTTFEDLISYFKETQSEMKTEFLKNDKELLVEFNEGCERYYARQYLNNL